MIMSNRILIIGLDGASPYLVEQWQRHLPSLAQLKQTGASGTLTGILPPRSVPAWYCFAAGMNPAKLGVFGFSQRLPGTYDYTFANLSFCQAPPFWQWLNERGVKTAVLHVPGTFPPHPVDGALVSGWPAPRNQGNLTYTHPPALSREIDQALGQPFEFLSEIPMRLDNDAEMLAERIRLIKMHGDVAHNILSQKPWQVGVVVLSPVDRASHQFWRHMDPSHPAHDPAAAVRFKDALLRVYRAADAEVGRLLSMLNENDTVFIISDHGFGPAYRTFYLNEWLRQEGYLVLQEAKKAGEVSWRTRLIGALTKPLFKLNHISPTFRHLADPFKKRALSNFIRDEYVRAKEEGLVRLNHAPVDWSRTRAYCPDESSLYLNLEGRDPQGIVTPGPEADALLTEIMKRLRQIPDPKTGHSIPVTLHRKEDIYSGPFLLDAPELLVAMDNYTTEVMAEMGSETLFAPNKARNGTHTLDGIFIAQGPGIRAGQTINANLVDIAPTAVHLAGVPIPEETDGEVLLRMYTETAVARQREIKWASTYLNDKDSQILTEEEQAQIEKQLRDLGYLA